MIITAKANGDILNIKPSVFYQGSTEANKIYLIAPFAISSSVSVGFTLPNMTDIPVTLMTPSTAISDTLNTWVYDVPVALTQYVGIVKVNISITTTSGTTITLNRCQFEVKRGDEVVLPDEPEADVYATIVQALADIYANFINKVDANYTDTENDIEQGVINNANGLKLVKTVGDVTVTFEVTENGVEIDGIDIKEQVLNAVSTANEANETAENAESVALGIDAKASEALENSEYAVETADEAKATADGIDAKATDALENSEYAVETADEAKAIALSKTNNKSFDTYAEMIAYVSDVVNKEKHTVGSEFFIAEDYYSEYWVKEVLTTPNENGYYYVLQQSESTVWKVNGQTGEVVLKTDDISDENETNKWSTVEEKEKVSKIVTDGDGKKALLNDGTYGEVGTVDTVNNVFPDENKNITITADDISDTSTTNKFATAEELAQIATNTGDITDLQDNKVDKEFSSDYTFTEGLVVTWKSDTNTYRVGDGTTTSGNGYTGTATEIIIPKFFDDGVHGIAPIVEIGTFAFRNITITSVKIPDSVTSIETRAFHGCLSLTSITIPNSVTSIGYYAFYNCSSLTSIIIPNSVMSIESSAFYNCSSLNSIIIPSSVISVGSWAFENCSNLSNVIMKPTTPPTIGGSTFNLSGISATTGAIYVPYSSLTAYKNATNWLDYADRIFAIPEGKWITEDITAIQANYVTTDTAQDITGEKTFKADVNIGEVATPKNLNIKGDLNIAGDIIQDGSTYETHAEQVYTTSDEIILRDGAVSGLAIGEKAGLLFKKYDGTNDGVLKVDKDGIIRVGDVGDEQPLATREDTPTDDGVARWDSATNKLITETPDTTPTAGSDKLVTSGGVKTALDGKATTASYTATLPYTSWTGSSAPYSKAVTVTGILATDIPNIDLNLSSATYANIPTIQSAWFNVYRTVQTANTITFYSHEIPSIDIPLSIKVVS